MDTFRIGERLTLELKRDGEAAVVVGAIVAAQADDGIELAFDDKPAIALPAGAGLRLSCGHERGCFVVGAVLLADLPAAAARVRVGIEGSGRYVQRREAFRVRCSAPVRFVPAANEEAALATDGRELVRGTLCDLSTTGIRFYSPIAVAERATVHLELALGEAPLVTAATVVRVHSVPRGWHVGGRFVRLSRHDDARLARFILETETRQRWR